MTPLAHHWETGRLHIQGWMSPRLLPVFEHIDAVQKRLGIAGNICEIGVYHGKLLIALAHMARDHETMVGIDVFEEQSLNIDRSGDWNGDRSIIESNIARWASDRNFHLIASTSLEVTPEKLAPYSPFRLFSVDGCHSFIHTMNDLQLAEETLALGGVIMVDDYGHAAWPKVKLATDDFLKDSSLRSFLKAGNKLFLTQPQFCEAYAMEVTDGDR